MSGRNIFLVLIAVLVAAGVYVLASGPGDEPVVPVKMTPIEPPRATLLDAPAAKQTVEPAPALDDVANDAAAEVERLKKEQEEMNEKPAPAPQQDMER